ncbi:MAG: hypothetical protein ACRELX_05470 [Longimicrobiales bacterium]
MRIQLAAVAAVVLGTATCAPEPTLEPAPAAQPAPSDGHSATIEESGVRMTAWSRMWEADPRDLSSAVTPLLVELRNDGTQPLRVRFNEFELVNPAGQNFQAIPPFQIDAEIADPVRVPAYPFSGFYVAPYLSPYYPGLDPFVEPWVYDATYYGPWITFWRERELPTGEMIEMALPEGVLEPGGVVKGFMYFEDVSDDAQRVTLNFDLVSPDGTPFGELTIPFTVID